MAETNSQVSATMVAAIMMVEHSFDRLVPPRSPGVRYVFAGDLHTTVAGLRSLPTLSFILRGFDAPYSCLPQVEGIGG